MLVVGYVGILNRTHTPGVFFLLKLNAWFEATCNFYFDQVLAFTFIDGMPDISFMAFGLFK